MRSCVARAVAGLAALGLAVSSQAAEPEPLPTGSGNDFPEICTRILCPVGQICGITADGTGGCIPAPATTVPPECAAITCLNTAGCGVRADGTVGCLPTPAPTNPPTEPEPLECARLYCPAGCGVLSDGSVGCFSTSTDPPTNTLPIECAAILCEVGNGCGFLPDGSVGCFPLPTDVPTTTAPPSCRFTKESTCFCPQVFDPTPCCNAGVLCTASNGCKFFTLLVSLCVMNPAFHQVNKCCR